MQVVNVEAGVNKSVVTATLVALALFALAILPSQLWLTQEVITQWLGSWLPENYILQVMSLFIICCVAMTVGMPRQFAAVACGYILGSWQGALVALIAGSCACLFTALLARYFFADFVRKKFTQQQQAIYQFLSINEFIKAVTIRLLPVGSNFLTNIVAGSCGIKLVPFVGGSTLGFIPQMIIFSLVGAGVKLSSHSHLLIALLLFFVALGLGIWLYSKEKRK